MTTGAMGRVNEGRRWSTLWPYALFVPLTLLAVASLVFATWRPIKVLPRIRLAPGFAFVNQAGDLRTSESYRGKVTLYSFSYTGCGAACAEAQAQLDSLRRGLAQNRPAELDLALVTISVDPERDTPATLARHTAQAPIDGAGIAWDWLVGEPTLTRYAVGGGFGVYYQAEPDGRVKLDPRYFLVDGWGVIRAEYSIGGLDPQRVRRDIDFLAAEVRNSDGPARLAYEAAHLFRCYP